MRSDGRNRLHLRHRARILGWFSVSPGTLNDVGAVTLLTACAGSLAWWWRGRRFDRHVDQALQITATPVTAAADGWDAALAHASDALRDGNRAGLVDVSWVAGWLTDQETANPYRNGGTRWIDARISDGLAGAFERITTYVREGYCTPDDVTEALTRGWGDGVAEGWLEWMSEGTDE